MKQRSRLNIRKYVLLIGQLILGMHYQIVDITVDAFRNRLEFFYQKEVVGMRLPVYYAPAMKSIEISLPWHSSTIPIAERNHDIIRGRLIKPLNPQHPAKPWSLASILIEY